MLLRTEFKELQLYRKMVDYIRRTSWSSMSRRIVDMIKSDRFVVIMLVLALFLPDTLAVGLIFLILSIQPFLVEKNYMKIVINALLNYIIIGILYKSLGDILTQNDDLAFLSYLFFMILLLCIDIIQMIHITYKIYRSEENIKSSRLDNINGFGKTVLKTGMMIENMSIKIVQFALPVIYYFFLMWLIIFLYANMYNCLNKYYEENNTNFGLYANIEKIHDYDNGNKKVNRMYFIYDGEEKFLYKQEDVQRIPSLKIEYGSIKDINGEWNVYIKEIREFKKRLKDTFYIMFSEYCYFSTTTFFTVGYGDIDIYGPITKMIIQSQMFMSALVNIIFIPMIIFAFTEYIAKMAGKKNMKINNSEYKKEKNEGNKKIKRCRRGVRFRTQKVYNRHKKVKKTS